MRYKTYDLIESVGKNTKIYYLDQQNRTYFSVYQLNWVSLRI
jgi:hypothetical protein